MILIWLMKIFDAKITYTESTAMTLVGSGPEVLTETMRAFIVNPSSHSSHGMKSLHTSVPQAIRPRRFQR
jgi:hypothetical protein